MGYVIKKNYISVLKYPKKAPYKMTPIGITIHNTASDASAANEISYMRNNNLSTSYHAAIDDKEVILGVPFNRNAFHAGDGTNGKGNRKTIGIEICYSKSGGTRFDQAEENAAHYVATLLKEYGWTIKDVYKHQDFASKKCPHRTIDKGWTRFKNMIQDELDILNGKKEPVKTEVSEKKEELKKEETSTVKSKAGDVYHRVYSGKWYNWVKNYGSGMDGYSGVIGKPLKAFQAYVKGDAKEVGYLEYRLHKVGGGWTAWQRDKEKNSSTGKTFAGNKSSKYDGLQMRVKGVNGRRAKYRVHVVGRDWLDWVTDYGNGDEGYAGWYGYAIDAVQADII